ncbi:MAG: PPC domain-containing DNA-binding protein [Candidatus Sericytochromatia bacterium]
MSNISKINTIYALRLKPNQDLREEIENFAKLNNIKAGFIITTVGSLKKASLRLSDDKNTTIIDDKFEIVSLVGTVSINGVHLHISLSDKTGKTIGAHLQKGSQVYTTAEIIIGEAEQLEFKREDDKDSGYKELTIYKRFRYEK